MRGIEFRAFVKRKKEMFPVTDLRFNRYEKDAVGVSGCGDPYCTMCDDWYNFDDVLLMQYTGLKDKNGKKIFEGDIVINSKGQIGYIAFLIQEAGFVVVLKNSDYSLGHRNTNECYERATHHKIIGNIHENPELMEGTVNEK
ncbi:YopX family protein [Listeria monocytogenes]|uniref:YopX family protein n=1 Tax=Listeria monocytogenes TaxID=1639 RepID=UPI00111D4AC2|nr:YopX family protein [Listeria monocytogenes]